MEKQITDNFKAILIKIALELKKRGWKANPQSSEINIFQGHIELSKEFPWDGQGNLPDVDVSLGLDLTVDPTDSPTEYMVSYKTDISLWIDNVGGDDESITGQSDVYFTEQDANNIAKIQNVANKLNFEINNSASGMAEKYAGEGNSDFQSYKSGGYKADQDLDR
jgi:hypothetical protein